MNIALGALILVLLILPAISFKFGIHRNQELKELSSTISITDSFWAFLFLPLVIHAVAIVVIASNGFQINFEVLYRTIIGDKDYRFENTIFTENLIEFLYYSIACFLIGYLIGNMFAWLEGLSEKYRMIRFLTLSHYLGLRNNKWYKYFEAELMSEEIERKIDLIQLDVLCNSKESTIIYSGFLYDYNFKNNSKELGSVVLKNAIRRDLRKEYIANNPNPPMSTNSYSDLMGTSISIQGDLLLIPFEEILNLNLTYINSKSIDIDQKDEMKEFMFFTEGEAQALCGELVEMQGEVISKENKKTKIDRVEMSTSAFQIKVNGKFERGYYVIIYLKNGETNNPLEFATNNSLTPISKYTANHPHVEG